MLAREGLADIIEWTEEFETESPDANQTQAIRWELCAMDVASDWTVGFDFGLCFNQCTTTFCPQPASDYLTEAKAKECAVSVGLAWSDIAACESGRGEDLRKASQQRYMSQCPGCPGPTTHINGGFAGHHPNGSAHDPHASFLDQICGNYTGTKPAGCSK